LWWWSCGVVGGGIGGVGGVGSSSDRVAVERSEASGHVVNGPVVRGVFIGIGIRTLVKVRGGFASLLRRDLGSKVLVNVNNPPTNQQFVFVFVGQQAETNPQLGP
jgi:hypothetical protein